MDPHTLSPPSVKPMATPLGLSINMSLLSTPEMPSATPDGAFTFEVSEFCLYLKLRNHPLN